MRDESLRDDHADLLRRRELTEDAARPDAVARRHAANARTARENIADLVDDGSFVEYGRFAIAAFSPRLNEAGNSVRAMHAIRDIAGQLGVGVFGANPE